MSGSRSQQHAVAGSAKMPSKASESRKIRKPLMEKKRRARINHSLNELKKLILDSNSVKKEGCARPAKLEKADILEMTVKHVQRFHRQRDLESKTAAEEPIEELNQASSTSDNETSTVDDSEKFRAGFAECAKVVRSVFNSLDSSSKAIEHSIQMRLLAHLQQYLEKLEGTTAGDVVEAEPAAAAAAARPTVIQTSGGYTLLPTRLPNGDLAFVIPADLRNVTSKPIMHHPVAAHTSASPGPPAHAVEETPQDLRCLKPLKNEQIVIEGDVWRPW